MRIVRDGMRTITDLIAPVMLRFLQLWLPSRSKSDSGALGERFAAEWLRQKRGFAVVVENWRSPRDRRQEIDLVCRDEGVLVFVEVKTRSAGALVPGYHAVDQRKKRVLRLAIESYLAGLREKPVTFRFDVVEVSFPPAGKTASAEPEVLHFENVPLFSKYFRS